MLEDEFDSPVDVRFVTPDEYRENSREHLRHDTYMLDMLLTRAVGLAADERGFLLRFHHPQFFERYVSAAMREPEDPVDWELKYSRFAFVVILDGLSRLVRFGLLGHRGEGDAVSYRLALPVTVSEQALSYQIAEEDRRRRMQ